MPIFIMLTRLNPDAVRSPRGLEQLEREAMKRVREECPDVEWLSSYAVLGPCDYLDIFKAKDIETAARVSTLLRTLSYEGFWVTRRDQAAWFTGASRTSMPSLNLTPATILGK